VTPLDDLLGRIARHHEVLVLGSGTSVVTEGLRARGVEIDVVAGDWPSIQLDRRYGLAVVEPAAALGDVAAAVHCGTQHVGPGGEIAVTVDDVDSVADRFDLRPVERFDVEGSTVALLQRTERTTIHDTVFAARSRIGRVTPHHLATQLGRDNAPTVVDTRTATDRGRFGVIEGSIHVPRTLVEWHLDPANGYRHAGVTSFDQPLVLVCNGGYSSSLAAANLLDLGFTDVGDLIGGVRAWLQAGFAVVEPDHTHLDF
jgi:rhodanese-related sulfurtransferase